MYFCRSLLELNISYDYFSISELGLRKSKYPNIYLNSKKKISLHAAKFYFKT